MAAAFSIEWEPRTLNFQEIQLARETALYVLTTNTMEEALQIFTKGLEEPVTDLQGRSYINVQETESEESDFDEEDDDDYEEEEYYTNSIFFMSHGLEDVSASPL